MKINQKVLFFRACGAQKIQFWTSNCWFLRANHLFSAPLMWILWIVLEMTVSFFCPWDFWISQFFLDFSKNSLRFLDFSKISLLKFSKIRFFLETRVSFFFLEISGISYDERTADGDFFFVWQRPNSKSARLKIPDLSKISNFGKNPKIPN